MTNTFNDHWVSPVVYYYDPTIAPEMTPYANDYTPWMIDDVPGVTNQSAILWQYFQNENGELDMDKVFKTLGQVMQLSQQITPIVKSLSTIVRPK
ncbi:hypothetical protein ABID56_002062 [Alkalibacillus flavidus]|uniref:Uncharacterized protein n=1 Tax=Alkalibacillus flavidus TaxID=546021 RepID=A0ABV2KWI1_9BACI